MDGGAASAPLRALATRPKRGKGTPPSNTWFFSVYGITKKILKNTFFLDEKRCLFRFYVFHVFDATGSGFPAEDQLFNSDFFVGPELIVVERSSNQQTNFVCKLILLRNSWQFCLLTRPIISLRCFFFVWLSFLNHYLFYNFA